MTKLSRDPDSQRTTPWPFPCARRTLTACAIPGRSFVALVRAGSGLRFVPPAPLVIAGRCHSARSVGPPPEQWAASNRPGQRRAISGESPFGRHGRASRSWTSVRITHRPDGPPRRERENRRGLLPKPAGVREPPWVKVVCPGRPRLTLAPRHDGRTIRAGSHTRSRMFSATAQPLPLVRQWLAEDHADGLPWEPERFAQYVHLGRARDRRRPLVALGDPRDRASVAPRVSRRFGRWPRTLQLGRSPRRQR